MSTQAVMIPTVRRARPELDRAARVLLLAAGLLLVLVLASMGLGYRALIVKSGSMAPAIQTGDVVVTKLVRPEAVHIGDVVTFRDPSRNEDLVTHRVQKIQRNGSKVVFETRGDANTGVEDWDIARDGTIGRYRFRIPRLGYALVWIAMPGARIALVVGACLLLGFVLLRSIWARPGGTEEDPPDDLSKAA
jgi:signal peptidase